MRNTKRKTGKQIALIVMSLCLILNLFLPMAAAKELPLSGGGTDGVAAWTFDPQTKTMTYSGNGKVCCCEVKKWFKQTEHVIIEEGISEIAEYTFGGDDASDIPEYYKNLKDVSFPSTLKKIGNNAFEKCYYLTHIELNEGLEYIGDYAFYGTHIVEVEIPGSVKKIGKAAFENWSSPSTTKVILHDGLQKIGKSAFAWQKMTICEIPDSVTQIGSEAFAVCQELREIHLPRNLTVLESKMFTDCKKLRTLVLPDSLTKIKADTFNNIGITSLTIPLNVEELGSKLYLKDGMFYDCKKLTKVNIKTKKLKKVYKKTFINTPKKVVFVVPKGYKKKYTKMLRKGGLNKKIKIKESKKW